METNASVVSLENRYRGKSKQRFLIALGCVETAHVSFF
jgi:hypothetical protein